MARPLPTWCKEAKKKLIDNDMSIHELADKIGLSRQYATSIVNGSDVLNIQAAYPVS